MMAVMSVVGLMVVIPALVRRNGLKARALLEPMSGGVAKITNIARWRWDGFETGQAFLLVSRVLWVYLGLELGALLDPVTRDSTQAADVVPRRDAIWFVNRGWVTRRRNGLVALDTTFALTFPWFKQIAVLKPVPRNITELTNIVFRRRSIVGRRLTLRTTSRLTARAGWRISI
jgi:hypothetical protein